MLKTGHRQPRTRQRRASAQVAFTMADMLEQVVCWNAHRLALTSLRQETFTRKAAIQNWLTGLYLGGPSHGRLLNNRQAWTGRWLERPVTHLLSLSFLLQEAPLRSWQASRQDAPLHLRSRYTATRRRSGSITATWLDWQPRLNTDNKTGFCLGHYNYPGKWNGTRIGFLIWPGIAYT